MNAATINTIPAKSIDKADPAALALFLAMREVAASQEITATEAVRQVLAKCPRASRIGVKHAAICAGINARTARNTFDRIANA